MKDKHRPIYSPSLMCANRLALSRDIDELIKNGVEVLHYDIADGKSVDAICLDLELLKAIRNSYPKVTLDVHIMVERPEKYLEGLQAAGADYVTVSLKEAGGRDLYEKIRALSMKPGIMIEPDMPIEMIKEVLPIVDMAVVMSITPGKKGIPFDENAYKKIEKLTRYRAENGLDYLISVDGGLDEINARKCVEMGVDVLVTGYFAFFKKGKSITDSISEFKNFVENSEVKICKNSSK